ncbi:MAG TPA: SDR family NAD(P)-dependent oxidoreductase, partial [Verrucomicrobiae bacterium]|nr:SDR family NAD(P)-dependent oxidoreductase [Verrucomicrobiae bacterium]
MRLAGKAALISGGARGMGAAEARLFAREGARVVIGDILEAEGKAVETDIKAKGGEALSIKLDVTSEADWQRAVEAAVSRFGQLDI